MAKGVPSEMSSWVLNRSLIFKLLRENSAEVCFMRYRTLCKSILKCGFPIKGIKLTWFILFEVLGVPWLWGTSVETISVGTAPEFAKYKWGNGTRDFSMLGEALYLISTQGISPSLMVFPRMDGGIQAENLALYYE